MASLQSIASVVGPPLFTAIFAASTIAGTIYYLPGAPFGLASIISLFALAIFLRGYALHRTGKVVEPPPDAKTVVD